MKEWVTGNAIVRCTKEIELQRWILRTGERRWVLDICAYGSWW